MSKRAESNREGECIKISLEVKIQASFAAETSVRSSVAGGHVVYMHLASAARPAAASIISRFLDLALFTQRAGRLAVSYV